MINKLFSKCLSPFALIFCFITANANSEIAVIDDAGRQLTLERPAQRIVGLSPHIIENLFAAGAGGKVIAGVAYSNYPVEAQALPQVGGFDTFNLERILDLAPDLVIAWGSGNGPRIIEQLERLNIPVYVNEPRRLEDITATLRVFGSLSGESVSANLAAARFQQSFTQLQREFANKHSVRVFYQIWSEPLQTVNGQHVISDVVSLCGGKNIFSDALSPAPKVNIESVLKRNPEVIVASGMDDTRPEWLSDWAKWPTIDAVKNNAIYHVPPDVLQRHTPRILQGAQLMCEYIDAARGIE